MPICTTCTRWIPFLYTIYHSSYNLRLEQCPNCRTFADPYVEHDTLTLLIDLILLKRGVYRHLLYNRGSSPRRAGESPVKTDNHEENENGGKEKRERSRWILVFRLGVTLVFLDAFIRWSHLNPNQSPDISPWSIETISNFTRIFVGCLTETLAFHSGILLACFVVLRISDVIRALQYQKREPFVSDIRREFRFSLVPLSLFYSSLTKLFLLFLLTIWRPSSSPPPPIMAQSSALPLWNTTLWNDIDVLGALAVLNDDQLDREWIVRNVLGGMSAGFGLRVILDIHPLFTTLIILVGWIIKNLIAQLISGWVGGDVTTGEAWLAYSIP